MPKIQRFFSEAQFNNFKIDISKGINKLNQAIKDSCGELDFQIRPDNKFNLYYKGNSLAEVTVQKNGYNIKIHEKFEPAKCAGKDSMGRFPEDRFNKSKAYQYISIKRNELLKFFQKKIITALASKIKAVNNGEEITFEQSLMTDNLDREDLIIIDRQVGGGEIQGKLDLLALRKIERAKYKFVVLEVKLGNNIELREKVVGQIENYIKDIENNIHSFQECYEKNYQQKKELGLFPKSFPDAIKIAEKVEGKIVVGLYSTIGRDYIKELSAKHPQWNLGENIIQFKNEL